MKFTTEFTTIVVAALARAAVVASLAFGPPALAQTAINRVYTKAAVPSQWLRSIGPGGAFQTSQPTYADIGGPAGVDPLGLVSSSPAINAALAAGVFFKLPCGVFLIDAPLIARSGSNIGGSGACTVLKISPSLATDTSAQFGTLRHVVTNSDYTSGNTDIYVHDLVIDSTAGPTTGVHIHAIGFYKVTRAGVYNVEIRSAAGQLLDDGTAFVASKEYYVRNNRIYGTINACIDQWEGSTDFVISGNLCDGLNLQNYGIVVSGFGTNAAPATTQRGLIANNVIRNFPGAGIWLQGGWNGVSGGGATYGLVKKISVVGNNISNVQGYHGVYLSDAKYNSIVGNTLETIGRVGIVISSENTGLSSENIVSDNVIASCNTAASGDPCILLTPYASYNTINNNTISGTAQPYSIVVNGGATGNIIRGGVTPVGASGDVSDAGTGTQVQIGNAFVGAPAFRSLTGYVKANGASAATAAASVPTSDMANVSEAAFRVASYNLNATGDTPVAISMPPGATRWTLFAVRVSHSTGNLPNGTATVGLYTGAGRTGTTLVAQQALNAVITSQADATAGNAGTTATAVGATQSFTATTIYLNVQTAQGATAAVDVAIVLRFF